MAAKLPRQHFWPSSSASVIDWLISKHHHVQKVEVTRSARYSAERSNDQTGHFVSPPPLPPFFFFTNLIFYIRQLSLSPCGQRRQWCSVLKFTVALTHAAASSPLLPFSHLQPPSPPPPVSHPPNTPLFTASHLCYFICPPLFFPFISLLTFLSFTALQTAQKHPIHHPTLHLP